MDKRTASELMLTLLLGNILFSAIILVEGETETHDLEVFLTADIIRDNVTYNHLSSGKSTVLNATVVNEGDFNEFDVTLQLLINGTMVLNATTPRLTIDSTFWTAYFWSPYDADYNLTVYAPPVSGEDNITNNVDTKWVRVCQDQSPNANFTYSPPPPPPGPIKDENVIFDASDSDDPDWGTILNYTWDFGDGNLGEGVTADHIYETWGNETVTLTLRDTENLTSSTSRNITVYARPVASFEIDTPRPLPGPYFVNETLTFNATASYDPDNSTALNKGIVNYIWNWGDGKSNMTQNPIITHTYTTEEDYNVTLNVTDYHGLVSHKFPKSVMVGLGRPVAYFTPPPEPSYVCYPLTFNASASYDPNNKTAPNKGIVNYTWDFDDGSTTTVTEPIITHHYQTNGTYNVNLTVADYEGLTDFTNKIVTVSLEVLVRVVDSETGNTDVVHNPGETFKINITVTNVVDLDYFEFTLRYPAGDPPPLLQGEKIDRGEFTLDEKTIADLQGQIRVNSTAHIGGVDGNFTLATITFSVTNPGNCTLRISYSLLKNSTEGNILHTPKHSHFYTTKPVPKFTQSTEVPSVNQTITFDASASYDPDSPYGPNHGIVNYTWNWGDGKFNITQTPSIDHTYTSEGNYTIMLTVTDDDNETWSTTHNKTVGFVHDIAVVDVRPKVDETAGILPIDVIVENQGNVTETFNVTIYCTNTTGSYAIGTQLVKNLEPSSETTLRFDWNVALKWNVTRFKGNYTIIANATIIPSEIDLADNIYVDGQVRVWIPGDIDRDGHVFLYDLTILGTAWDSRPDDPNWDKRADLDCDGHASLYDLTIIGTCWDEKDC